MTTLALRCPAVLTNGIAHGEALLIWDDAEPIVMNLVIDMGLGEPISFQFSRELLDMALAIPGRPSGSGDVIIEEIEPGGPGYRLELNVGSRPRPQVRFLLARDNGPHAGIVIAQEGVMDLVTRSFVVVPANRESADVDGALRQILGSSR